MRAWARPALPAVPGRGAAPLVFSSAAQEFVEAKPEGGVATMYVCGITPYDATHLGHAATYLAFDTLQRLWRDAGYPVRYAQNVTDVDDPLLERATATGVDWRELAAEQIELFRSDMAALGIIPPDDFVAVTDVVDDISAAVAELLARGVAYRVAAPDASASSDGVDVYFDSTAAADVSPWRLGDESRLPPELMELFFAERGGDPERASKRDRLDPLLWRAAREGEPSWPSPVGAGRPGWHIECAVIALDRLGSDIPITVQGGGSDLVFPHHEFSAGHAAVLSGHRFAQLYAHSGMVACAGEKMSKSLGNLVLVSTLRQQGAEPQAIRLALLAHHYRSDWEWASDELPAAQARLDRWRDAIAGAPQAERSPQSPSPATEALRAALREDLDTPRALDIVDAAFASGAATPDFLAAIELLLGIRLG